MWVRAEEHESHECSTRKICENLWNLWDNILKQRAEEPPTDIADLHGFWVREITINN